MQKLEVIKNWRQEGLGMMLSHIGLWLTLVGALQWKLSTTENSLLHHGTHMHTHTHAHTHTHTHTRTHAHTRAHTHTHTHTPSNRLFLIVKLYYAYAIFATYMVQFYVPMDFLEPPLIETVHCLFPHHHARIECPVKIIFRTFVVAITGEFFWGHRGSSLSSLHPAHVAHCVAGYSDSVVEYNLHS